MTAYRVLRRRDAAGKVHRSDLAVCRYCRRMIERASGSLLWRDPFSRAPLVCVVVNDTTRDVSANRSHEPKADQ